MIVAHPQETYGQVTPAQWRDGLRYAEILCHRFLDGKPSWADCEALYSAALDGLMRAARTYRPELGAWSTLMTPAIQQALLREWIAQQNAALQRPPTSRFWKAKGYDPKAAISPVSLDALAAADGDRLGELRPASNCTEAEVLGRLDRDQQCADLERVLAALTERERDVLVSRAHGQTFQELGQRYGRSRERIRQVERIALRKARAAAGELGLQG